MAISRKDVLIRFLSNTEGLKKAGKEVDELSSKEEKAAVNRKKQLEASINALKKFEKAKKRANSVDEIDAFNKKIEESKRRIELLGGRVKKADGIISSLRGNVLKLGAQFAGAFAIKAIVSDATETIVEFDESIANLRKTTGLSAEAARDLAKTLLEIDTKTSVTELLELATAAGRLGVAEDQIRDFVEEVDKLFVALGDDLAGSAEEIATNIGKIVSVFGIEEAEGLAEGLNKVGSVFNELGANSKANAGFILDFTNRLAGVGPAAGLSVTEVAAFATVLDEAGQSVEVSATTLNQLIPLIGKDLPKFAKLAGVSLEEFSKTLKEDAFEAMLQVFEGSKSASGGIEGLADTLQAVGVDGARASSILGILSNKTDDLRKFQNLANTAFEEGVSLTNEFNIKNNTLSASTEKLSKAWDIWILSIDSGEGVISKSIRGLVDLATSALKLGRNQRGLADDFFNLKDEVENLENNITPLLDRYDELQSSTELTKKEQAELDSIIQTISETLPTAISAFDEYGKAMDISSESARRLISQQQNLLLIKNAEAIEEQEENLSGLNQELRILNRLNKVVNGELLTYNTLAEEFLSATEEETIAFQKSTGELQNRKDGVTSLIAELKGLQTQEQRLAAEAKKQQEEAEKARQREADALAKKKREEEEAAKRGKRLTEKEKKELEKREKARKKEQAEILKNQIQVADELRDHRLEDNEKELFDIDQHFNKLKELKGISDERIEDLEEARIEARNEKRKEQNEKEIALEKDKQDKLFENQQEITKLENELFFTKVEFAEETTNILGSLSDRRQQKRIEEAEAQVELAKTGTDAQKKAAEEELKLAKKQTASQKAFFLIQKGITIAQIVLNAQAEIAAINAAAAANPANVVTAGGAGVAQSALLTGIAVARAAVSIATVVGTTIAGFKEGEYTGDVGVDQVAGFVHGQEYVLDAKTTKKYSLKGKSMKDFNEMADNGELKLALGPKDNDGNRQVGYSWKGENLDKTLDDMMRQNAYNTKWLANDLKKESRRNKQIKVNSW